MLVQDKKFSKKAFNIDAPFHVSGRTKYLDDIPELQGTLYARVFYSSVAHGEITKLDFSKALLSPGVERIISYKDVPGENQIGGIIPDEPLLAEKQVHFIGQPILIVLTEKADQAHAAFELIEIEFEEKRVLVDPREAFFAGELLHDSRTFEIGNSAVAFEKCTHVFEGTAESGGQEHLYLETQGAYAVPQNRGSMIIYSSTQGPTQVQRTCARVLGVSMNQIEVDVNRIGGGFGGKEDQASPWAAMVALGAHFTGKPVKYILDRHEDLQMTGKRHPYKSNYKIGFDADFKIKVYQATFFQNGGAAADLSPAVMERTLFHATNSYSIPHVSITAHGCKTNLPPNTAFRGFGGPQGMFVIESALHQAARNFKIPYHQIQEINLMDNGMEFPYGQIVEECEAKNCWEQAKDNFELKNLEKEISDFNAANGFSKKALSFMPVCFGISFTNTPMNNARALVHIYSDGSVGVSTGAVEMGQGVNTKMIQVAAQMLGIGTDRIKLENTNTTRVANTSPTAASATADLNGKALQDACFQLLSRLKQVVREDFDLPIDSDVQFEEEKVWVEGVEKDMSWNELISAALLKRVNCSAKGHYATPKIKFDKSKEKGHPFAYHVYGTAITVVTVDCIRGIYDFDAVKVVHDFGASMNKAVDLGQIEGGLVQGMGWMTLEDVVYNEKGQLKSGTLASYKIPDFNHAPNTIDVEFLETEGSDLAILKSKAVGEPPLMYGIGAYFSIANAILAFNPNATISYVAPMTTEKVLMALYS